MRQAVLFTCVIESAPKSIAAQRTAASSKPPSTFAVAESQDVTAQSATHESSALSRRLSESHIGFEACNSYWPHRSTANFGLSCRVLG